jgi:hypothetical protein
VATVLIPQAIQISLFGHTQDGASLLHSFHARAPHSPVLLSDCQTLAAAVATWTVAGLQPIIHDRVAIDRVVCTAIDFVDGPQYEEGIHQGGSRTGDPLPSEVTLALKKAGTSRGRSKRGRFYAWPTVTSDLDPTDGNRFLGAYQTDVLAAYNGLITAMNAAGMPLCIGSTRRGALFDVTSIVLTDDLVDHQGRRAAGRGR